jgi:ribA/ribD-fused uncharacterized protein
MNFKKTIPKYNIENITTTKCSDYHLFWGGFCSQWASSPFNANGMYFATAEHWMMIQKALLFEDNEQLQNILADSNPRNAKNYGRRVKNFDPEVWEEVKYDIVLQGNLHKFAEKNIKGEDNIFRQQLLETGDKIIVEASPYDKIWGIGLHSDHRDACKPLNWKGQNLLGFALMEVRDTLK